MQLRCGELKHMSVLNNEQSTMIESNRPMLSSGRGSEEDKMTAVSLCSRKVGFTTCKQIHSQINEK